jgi:hypothetical protein
MQLPADIRPDERLLILGIPPLEMLETLSRCIPKGLVVALGEEESVREARKAAVRFENVTCVPGSPEQIPWRDGFFTRVLDLVGHWPDSARVRNEIQRVTSECSQPVKEA